MSTSTSLRRVAAPLAVLVVALTALTATPAQADRNLFFEETAGAFWSVPHECADGSIVQGTLLVQSTRDFEAPDTEDADPSYVWVTMRRLRQKVEVDPNKPVHLLTVRGIGYRLVGASQSPR